MVENYDPALVNPASLDVRLGEVLMIESAQSTELVPMNIGGFTADNPYLLVPGQFVLAETIEIFHLPETIAAQFILKSSRAREGINNLLAGFCDPGWHGSRLTLELKNERQLHGVSLFPGMKIGQIVFHRMSKQPLKSYAEVGNYNNDLRVTPSKVAA